ncbi:MAG: hypothetical protein JXQ90_22165 [Cyclobacteriaceae bacterium]
MQETKTISSSNRIATQRKHVVVIAQAGLITDYHVIATAYNVQFTESREEASSLLAAIDEKVSLIIIDHGMNLEYDLARDIRSIEQYKYVPILIVGDEITLKDKIQTKKNGVTGWLQRHEIQTALINVVDEITK